MNERDKRRRFHEILGGNHRVLAPSMPEPLLARLVQDCGYQLMHIAGNGMHRSLLLADESLVTMTEMAERARAVAEALDIPVMVDAETGYGGPPQAARAIRLFERAGAAGLRLEDGLFGKSGINRAKENGITPIQEMCEKIKAAADARVDESFVIAIRCDGRPGESLQQIQERCTAYRDAGADVVGLGPGTKEDLAWFGVHIPQPLMASWTASTGLKNVNELFDYGYRVALMPSNVHLAALAGARAFLLDLARTGTTDSLAGVRGMDQVRRWYGAIGFRTPEPFVQSEETPVIAPRE